MRGSRKLKLSARGEEMTITITSANCLQSSLRRIIIVNTTMRGPATAAARYTGILLLHLIVART